MAVGAERHQVVAGILGDARYSIKGESSGSSQQRQTKRAIDVVGAWMGLVLLAIPSCVVALLIRVTSPGPVLFRQKRVGEGGVNFEMIKFRTMREGTDDEVVAERQRHEELTDADFKLPPDDPRITPVGRVLRKLSIDEIPQFVNVLRGEMSLVGIRPLVRAELEIRPAADQRYYAAMRPGLTGLWQIDGRSSRVPHERLELDRAYVDNWSNRLDVTILARTVVAVFRVSRTH